MGIIKKYKFLIKPVFFILNLLVSTWLVFQIEKISPSDFGRYRYWFEHPPKAPAEIVRKNNIKKLCEDYKAGAIDSTQLENKLDKIMRAN